MKPITIGDPAPDFNSYDQDGKPVSLQDYKGKKLALYFYPKDMTPGCTTQACNLRDHFSELKKAGIYILGVSTDEIKRHKKFEEKYALPFPLLADSEKEIVSAYGVWREKQFMGKKFMGTVRTTFLINEQGRIEHIIEKVVTKDHAAQIQERWSEK